MAVSLMFDPHGDDVPLFAAYSAMTDPTHVVVTHPEIPNEEIRAAADILGYSVTIDSSNESRRRNLAIAVQPEIVYAPAIHPEGHEHHNEIGQFAVDFYGRHKVQFYATYAPRGQRQRTDRQVVPMPWEILMKLQALACFESQIKQESTRPWFYDLLDMREWLA